MEQETREEYQAWQALVAAWPGDINDPRFTDLVNAVRHWGERLAAMRHKQSDFVRESALRNAEVKAQ